jgi:serine/threonine-protein kinase HipA
MLFNAMIGNTDDHLKNFSLLHTHRGWQLSPAYDLLPDTENRIEHVLNFAYSGLIPTKDSLLSLGKIFGLTVKKTNRLYANMRNAIQQWHIYFKQYQIHEKEYDILSAQIINRLKHM